MMKRSNETWLAQLQGEGPERESALRELRQLLIRGLRYGLADRGVTDEPLLEDSVQEALLLILDRLHQFRGHSRFTTWATAIAIRVAMSALRRRHWRDVSLDELIETSGPGPGAMRDDNAEMILRWERQAVLDHLYRLIESELTEKQRRALIAELKGVPQDEIARLLGSNRNAVYKLTHDARKRLKRGFESAGYRATDIQAVFED